MQFMMSSNVLKYNWRQNILDDHDKNYHLSFGNDKNLNNKNFLLHDSFGSATYSCVFLFIKLDNIVHVFH